MRRAGDGTAGEAGRRRRAGWPTLAVGVMLTAVSVLITSRVTYPTGLGVMLGLSALYLAGLYALLIGVVRVRSGPAEAVTLAGRGWVCVVTDHAYAHVRAATDVPEHWRCRRCGHRRYVRPTSAGETLGATRADLRWIDRGDAPGDGR